MTRMYRLCCACADRRWRSERRAKDSDRADVKATVPYGTRVAHAGANIILFAGDEARAPRTFARRMLVISRRLKQAAGSLALFFSILPIASCSRGAKGWMCANSGQVIGIISLVALSFMVQEPSGIIERSSATSLSASRRR